VYRVHQLYDLFDTYNAEYFGGRLLTLTLLIKNNKRKDGWFEYAAHKDWTPIVKAKHRSHIVICDGCWEEGTVEGTLLHEMVHQYQAEVLQAAPHHDAVFKSICRRIERDGYILR
jgi:hypothetical protein